MTCIKSRSLELTETSIQVHPVHPAVPGTGTRRHHPDAPLACAGWNPDSAAPPAPTPDIRAPPGPGAWGCSPRVPYLATRCSPELPLSSLVCGHGDQTGPGVTSASEAGTEAGSGGKCERRAVGNGATPSPVALRLLRSCLLRSTWATDTPSNCVLRSSSQSLRRRWHSPGQPRTPE